MNLIKKYMIHRMRAEGYSSYFAPVVLQKRYDDLFKNKETTWKQKIWAQKRGFLSDKIAFYGLTDENYKDYLSDFDYYKMHPINGQYSKWIDDKLTIKYILHPFSQYIPKYYYQLGKGEVLKLMDCPCEFKHIPFDIIALLKQKINLAVKPLSGSAGEGFYRLQYCNDVFYSNHEVISEQGLQNLIYGWIRQRNNSMLITEYLSLHKKLAHIWPETANPLRLTVIREKNHQPVIISALIRFGTKSTGVVDNALAGGVFSKVDIKTGIYEHGKILRNDILTTCTYHPDSKEKIEGIIPDWELLVKKTLEICKFMEQVIYMGIDIIITDDGFKIIEINSHPNIEFIQYDIPAFKNQLCSNFYKNLIKTKKRKFNQ